jgi:hypothetical protein
LIVTGNIGVKETERLIKKLELDKEILADQDEGEGDDVFKWKRPPTEAALHAEAMTDLAQHSEGHVRVTAIGQILVYLTCNCQRQCGYGGTLEHDKPIVRRCR